MGLERFLDLFRKDLLAGGVDAGAAAAEQGQAAVGLDHTPVAGNRIAHPIDNPEGTRRLFFILVVTDRIGRRDGDHARQARTRRDRLVLFVKHLAAAAQHELGGLDLRVLGHQRHAHAQGFGRRKSIVEDGIGHVRKQASLDLQAPHHAR